MAFRRLGDYILRYLGIGGASGDASNPLSVRGPGALFDGDTGGHQLRINKSAVGDTASYLFQTGFSGRAEFGLIGNDDFELKVSPDGASFFQSFVVDKDTGDIDFKQALTVAGNAVYDVGDFDISNYAALTGAAFTGALTTTGTIRGATGSAAAPEFSFTADTDTGMYRAGANNLGFAVAGGFKFGIASTVATFDASITSINATGASLAVNRIGVGGATPDAINQFSANTEAALFNNAGGDIRLTLNKNAVGDDATLTFQDAFSTMAQMGLSANDDFSIKVGSSFTTAMVINKDTGVVSHPAGARSRRVVDVAGRWYCYTDNRWVGFSTSYGISSENHNQTGGTGTEPTLSWAEIGIYMREGDTLENVLLSVRAGSALITAFNWRIHFHHATPDDRYTETPANPWSASSETNRVSVLTEDNVTIGAGWYRKERTGLNFTAPKDGHLMLFIKPVSTLTATNYIYASGIFEILTAK